MSYRTVSSRQTNRQINKKVKLELESLNKIKVENIIIEKSSQDSGDTSDDELKANNRSSSEIDLNIVQIQEPNYDCYLNDDHVSNYDNYYDSSSYSDNSDYDSDPELTTNIKLMSSKSATNTLSDNIKIWALKHNITHNSLDELLTLLHEQDDSIPNCARTLLSTNRKSNSKPIGVGQY